MHIKSQFLHNGGSEFPRRWVVQLSRRRAPCDRIRHLGAVILQWIDDEILRNLQICHVKFSQIPFWQKIHQHRKEKSSLNQHRRRTLPTLLGWTLISSTCLAWFSVFLVFQCVSAINIINKFKKVHTHTSARLLACLQMCLCLCCGHFNCKHMWFEKKLFSTRNGTSISDDLSEALTDSGRWKEFQHVTSPFRPPMTHPFFQAWFLRLRSKPVLRRYFKGRGASSWFSLIEHVFTFISPPIRIIIYFFFATTQQMSNQRLSGVRFSVCLIWQEDLFDRPNDYREILRIFRRSMYANNMRKIAFMLRFAGDRAGRIYFWQWFPLSL